MKVKIKRVYEDLYKAPVYFLANCTSSQAKEALIGELKIDKESLDHEWGAAHTLARKNLKTGNIIYIVWIGNLKHKSFLIHELLHLTGFILADRNVRYDSNNDEPFCYLIERLYKLILRG
jgi:hypothetical protein